MHHFPVINRRVEHKIRILTHTSQRRMGNSRSTANGPSSSPREILEKGSGWVADHDRVACFHCETSFTFLSTRRHHCRLCGEIFCDKSECWGGKAMLPRHLFVDVTADPLSGSSASPSRSTAQADASDAASQLKFLTTPQPLCTVCFAVLNGPLRKVGLTLPESAVNRARHVWMDPQYRRDAPEHVIHIRVVSVGQKGDSSGSATLIPPVMYAVNRRYRLHLDAWRPFNKQTRMLFCAVDVVGDDDADGGASTGDHTPRERSGSGVGGGVSAMRRARRKSRTDLVFDVPSASDNEAPSGGSTSAGAAASKKGEPSSGAVVTLPNRWSLSGTSVFLCELTEMGCSPSNDGVRLETFSDIIVLATDTTVAPHFTLSTTELYQVVKQTIGFARVRGKVRVSSMKAPSSKLLKKA